MHVAVPKERGMESIRELYRIGRGPSSSHTMGPEKICLLFSEQNPEAEAFHVTLYGSLSKTGKGHGTDVVIEKTLAPKPVTIVFSDEELESLHPNTMDLSAISGGKTVKTARAMSVGGGRILFIGEEHTEHERIYREQSFDEIRAFCEKNALTLPEYVKYYEGEEIYRYLAEIWKAMQDAVTEGLENEGVLPGGLGVHRKAKLLKNGGDDFESEMTRENRLICAFAFAVSEQNAAGEKIVTAPTCGASGVLPAVLYYYKQKYRYSEREILDALAVASIIGNLIKTNASISGAECGCQAEVGTACAMTAAALGSLLHFSFEQIEYAAEVAIEHHLGLTCDPICGLVQIPCIERNAVAAMRAINAANLARILTETSMITLDDVIAIMKQTGLDLSNKYKETSDGGLAVIRPKNKIKLK